MRGTVYGLGVGPGDPELITLKAHRILARVPVIVYPATAEGQSLARAIALPHLNPAAREIAIRIPIDSGDFSDASLYDEAARTIEADLDAGLDVAVLCEGDPFFYGSFMYLFARLSDRQQVASRSGCGSSRPISPKA